MTRPHLRLALCLFALVLATPAFAQAVMPRGEQLMVNTFVPGTQFSASIAVRDGDGYLVVWSGGGTLDDPLFNVFARRYTLAGTPLSDEVRVSTAVEGDQAFADSATLPGGFVAVWTDDPSVGTSTEFSRIRGRLLDSEGRPLGSEIPISTFATGFKNHPSVAATPDGGFLVGWDFVEESTGVSGIFGRRFGADGAALTPEFPVNTFTTVSQSHPEVAFNSGGTFVVTWNSNGSSGDDNDESSIQARRFLPSGLPVGDEFQVNSYIIGVQGRPQPVFTSDDELVVVWGSGGSAGSDQDNLSIQGRRFGPSGDPLGDDFQVNTQTEGFQAFPNVAANSSGEIVVAWHSSEAAGEDPFWGVRARQFDAQGNPLAGDFQVNTYVDDYQIFPEVQFYDDDQFVVAWEGAGELDPTFGIHAQRYRAIGSCQPSPSRLCLVEGRFQVEVDWLTPAGARGKGNSVQLTGNTGHFWFFREENVEMVVKVLDACTVNEKFWFFAGGLTNVRAEISVLDTWTGLEKRYSNPQRTAFQPLQDTGAFASCDAAPLPGGTSVSPPVTLGEQLPLVGGRFTVEAQWTRPDGSTGAAQGVSLTDNTGYLWFFRAENVEMVLKVLDACSSNDHFWVFAGGLTNVEVDIEVTDTETGARRKYRNPPGSAFQPIQDTEAFATCP